jgi:tetratricopeptide (TPR) repeat protein
MQPPPAAWARLSDRPIARAVLEKLPMFAISILFGVIILAVQSRAELMAPIDRHPPAARLAQAIYGLAYYPRRLLWPVDLLPLYELPARIDPLAMPILLSAAGIATCAAVLIAFRRRLRALIAAGAIYVVIVAPVLGWLQTGTQLVADRYSYLSCIALAVVAGGGVLALLRSGRAMVRLLTVIAAAVLLVTLGIMSHRYATAWQTSRSLWAYATRSGRESPTAHNNYGAALLAAGEHDAAIEQFRSAIALRPWHANAWFNIGRAEAERGDLPAAEASIRSGLAYMPGNAAARLMLAECLLLSGRESEAALELQAALRDDPTLEPARRRLEQIAPRLINAPP